MKETSVLSIFMPSFHLDWPMHGSVWIVHHLAFSDFCLLCLTEFPFDTFVLNMYF